MAEVVGHSGVALAHVNNYEAALNSKPPSILQPVSSPPNNQSGLPSASLSNPRSPPMRRVVSSASEMPQREIKAAIYSQHVASDRYIEYHRKAMERLREAHRNERAAWVLERHELHAKIVELETKIKRLQGAAFGGIGDSLIGEKLKSFTLGNMTALRSASTPGDFVSATPSRHSSVSGLQRAGNTDLVDTGKQAMESISEERDSERHKSVSFAAGRLPDADINRVLEGFAIPGHLIDKDLDGIAIKATSLPPATKKAIISDSQSGTPSPIFSPQSPGKQAEGNESPSMKRPVTIEIPSTQQILQLPAKDLNTYAAGNTPLARLTDDEDESNSTGGATPKMAPIAAVEKERPPLEPYPSTFNDKPLRPPNERSDSYFNIPITASESKDNENLNTDTTATDEDPALKGPLMMPSHPPKTRSQHPSEFLDRLDERLSSLSRQQSHGSDTGASPERPLEANKGEFSDLPLRTRRSTNFGSEFGFDPRAV